MNYNKLKILTVPNKILLSKSENVTDFERAKRIVSGMFTVLYDSGGVGLAAPQVGILERIIVINPPNMNGVFPTIFINPEIVYKSTEKIISNEGCLSIPGYNDNVSRYREIKINYNDLNGNLCEYDASGIISIILQHEIDHLNGILFIDHLSKLKKNIVLRKQKKRKS